METNEMLAQMLGVLRRETELYQVMSSVMDKEKDAAIQSNLIALNEAEIEKENVLVALGLLEKQRRDLVTALAESLGHSSRDLSLDRISQIVDEPFALRLKQARSELSTIVEVVQVANQRNKQIFEHSRELIRGSYNLLSEVAAPNPIYYRTGTIQNTSSVGKCVCDEI
jgi:flagellar biosynthesis/type III secretory pathway chaperone